MRRPIRARVWFWKPEWYFAYYWDRTISPLARLGRILSPVGRGGDEFDWHTIVIGWTFTGRVIIATRPCPETGRCATEAADRGAPLAQWPIDAYGHNHLTKEPPA